MPIFPRLQTVDSAQNGVITLKTWLGKASIFVDGFDQSSPYIRAMWRKALRRVPTRSVGKVLMLGLGTGSALPEIEVRWPKAHIIAVEWDPVMIQLYKESKPSCQVDILQGDAAEIVPSLTEKFDVVLVDLYHGKHPAPVLSQTTLLTAIARVTAADGYCLVNAFGEPLLLDKFSEHFKRLESWRYKYNRLAAYSSLVK